MLDILGSGLSFPLGVDHAGGLSLASGEADVEQAIGLILATAPGERSMRPEFGCAVHDLVFETIDAAAVGRIDSAVRAALERWEPRIEVQSVDVDLAGMREGRVDICVGYHIRATSSRRNLVHPFFVIPDEEA